ncbi:MAG: YfhO family protein [Bacteroidales bacterium]|nr:YfhO family protein [Bacteroidales bacterium]
MGNKTLFKTVLSKCGVYVAAVVIFLALAYIYCSPQLKGKVLNSGDQQTFTGAVHESEVYHQETGDYTFWTGSMFSGMPNYQIGGGYYSSFTFLKPINTLIDRPDSPAWIIFLYFICFFICLRCFDVDRWLSIVGALAIGLSSYFIVIIGAGHLTKTMTIAATAVVLGGFNLIFSKKQYVLGAILTAVFVAGGATKHPQMFYYYFMLIGLLWFTQLISHLRQKKGRDMLIGTAVFVVAVGLGLGANSANVFANAEYTRETIRGGRTELVSDSQSEVSSKNGLDLKYATEWSYGIDESLSFLVPGAKGGATGMNVGKNSKLYKTLVSSGVPAAEALRFSKSAPRYWGEQLFTLGNVYMGAIVSFLFLLGCLIVPGPHKWGLLIGTLFSVMLAWGHNFMGLTKLFFAVFPLYNKFRAVSSILIVAEVAMPLLGFLAIREIMQGKVEKKRLSSAILISAGVTGAICLVLALFGGSMFSFTSANDSSWTGMVPDWSYTAVQQQRMILLRTDSLRSLAFIAASALTLWFYSKGVLKSWMMTVILAVLVLADMWPVDRRYFNDSSFVQPAEKTATFEMLPYEEVILKDRDPHFRVLNLTTNTYNESRTSYYLESLGGYSAAKLRRYQDLIDRHLSKNHMPVINMLNAKYIITPSETGTPLLRRNANAMGNAWIVSEIMTVSSPEEEIDALDKVDLGTVAVVGSDFAQFVKNARPGKADNAFIRLTSYAPNSIDYSFRSSSDATVVFSEIYYPYGWKATIDGKKAEHFRADYALRAMNIPAGTHRINFTFDPDSVRLGNTISIICIMLIYLGIAAAAGIGIWRAVRKKEV